MCARLKLAEIRQSIFFSLMADEYTDVSNKEQVSICLCWVNSKKFKVHEDFNGFYKVSDIQSTTTVQAAYAIIRLNIPISRCHDQTYDGVSNTMGKMYMV